jgi:ABC-type glycerol-3-phosphate transport system permease component
MAPLTPVVIKRKPLIVFTKKNLIPTVVFVLLVFFAIPYIFPLFWMLGTALKTSEQVYAFPPVWIPNPIVLKNFITAWTAAPFTRFLVNSLITTLIPMAGEIFVSAMVAYAFSRVRWPGRDKIFGLCLATMLLPGIVTLIPLFVEFRMLGWIDTFLPLVVPALFGNAFYIFIFRQFMQTLPRGLEEAARIDGASTWQIFVQIILPLLGPAMATVAVFSFIAHWNDFLMPMIYLHKPDMKTLTLGLANFESMMTGVGGNYALVSSRLNLIMAISFLIDLPCIILFILFQKYFVRDVITTGFK